MIKPIRIFKTLVYNSNYRCYLLVGIAMATLVATAQPFLVGRIYSEAKAIELVEGLQSSSLYFGSAIATASSTVLALMLTLLSMTRKSDSNFDRSIYRGIEIIGLISTVTFVGSLLLLLCLSLPVGEFENIPEGWFRGLYYVLATLNGVLSGLMVAGVLILFDTVKVLIRKLMPHSQQH